MLVIVLLSVGVASAYPALTKYVTDLTGTMSAQEIADLNAKAADIDVRSGVEIAMVMVQSTGGTEPLAYARGLGDAAGIGKKGVDNGIVVLWVVDVQRGAIATGPGIVGVVTDENVRRMGSYAKVLFLSNEPRAAFASVVDEVGKEVAAVPVSNVRSSLQQSQMTVAYQDQVDANAVQLQDLAGKISSIFPFMLIMMVIIIIVSVLWGFFNAREVDTYDDSDDEESEKLVRKPKKPVRKPKKPKKKSLPKKLPKGFLKKHKLVKRKNGKIYQRRINKSGQVYYHQCSSNWLLWLWVGYSLHSNSSASAASAAATRSSDSSSSSSSSYSGGGGFSGGGGGGFGGGGGGGGSFGGGGGFSGGGGGGGGF